MRTRRRISFRRLVPFLALLLALAGCAGEVSVDPPKATGLSADQRIARGSEAVASFVGALNARDPGDFADAVDSRFADDLDAVLGNADLVGAGPVSAEYVDSLPGGLSAEERSRYGPEAWLASVRLRYRLDLDGAPSSHETAVVLTPHGDGARVASLGGHDARSPLWLTERLEVSSQGPVTVLNAGSRSTRTLLRQGVQAVRDVRRTLPSWDGRLVVEVPDTKADLDRTLVADPDTYANIAAVTTTADGSVVPDAPVHVFLNPDVFGTLKQKGARVVMAHEATHVATGASFVSMPIWLLEGFADYVALKPAGVPVQRAAAQVIDRMRKDGLPDSLPSPEELQPTAEGLGATYEEAWLACRFLADRWGERSLVRFHDAVAAGDSLGAAFRAVLGVSEGEFVRQWRADLAVLVKARVAR